MTDHSVTRRDMLKLSSAALAAAGTQFFSPDFAFPGQSDVEELVPFFNMPRTPPNRLDWEMLDSWLTPQDQVFNVQHYGIPEFDVADYTLEITGLVKQPRKLTLPVLKARPAHDQFMTLECSGNGASSGFMNAIYNSRWTGTPLLPLLEECGIDERTTEVVFLGLDTQDETLREGTKREVKFNVPFGRGMSLAEVREKQPLLAYARDGKPLEKRNGAPLRLIVPGWYGIANVKWLNRIELRDRRYMGRYMARDYVTVRGERHGDEVVFVETSITRMNLKSLIARVTRKPAAGGRVPLKAYGAVWSDGTPIEKVEVRIDGGDWQVARLDDEPHAEFSWRFFSIDLGPVPPGKHVLVSRGVDAHGRVQPEASDDEIALKRTYWEAYAQWPREIDVAV